MIWLYYAPWRLECRRCGVTVEQVPWARHAGRFTWALEELVAYMARSSINCTTISRLVGISWRAVAGIIGGVVAERVSDARLTGLRAIGVDEFSVCHEAAGGHKATVACCT